MDQYDDERKRRKMDTKALLSTTLHKDKQNTTRKRTSLNRGARNDGLEMMYQCAFFPTDGASPKAKHTLNLLFVGCFEPRKT